MLRCCISARLQQSQALLRASIGGGTRRVLGCQQQHQWRTISKQTRLCANPVSPPTPEAPAAVAASGPTPGSRFFIAAGTAIFGVLLFDNYLQYQNEQQAKAEVERMAAEEKVKRKALFDEFKDKPTLYTVKAIFKYKMGGTMGLRGVQVGDVMEVLQEKVGPNKGYYLARTLDENGQPGQVGWYPMSFCETFLDNGQPAETETKRKQFLGLF